ncbi:MAG: HhH-GPD family protein [Thermoleophilia bacterium]|nr:HhH-GPD family protein [Thermoleophilia bacterium]
MHDGYRRPETLEFTTDPDANRLNAQEPVAFVIGWILDQQVKVQKAFEGPLELQRRLGGTLSAATIAAMPEQDLIDVFVAKPALHRFGGVAAKRVRACMQHLVDEYGGDPERVWLEAADYPELRRRIVALPGFGPTKAPAVTAVLVRRFGLDVSGFEDELFEYGSLADVATYDDLLAYQARKTAYKQAAKAAKAEAAGE